MEKRQGLQRKVICDRILKTTRCAFAVASIVFLSFALGISKGHAFEQDQRINALMLQFATDAFATSNAFERAFAGSAQGQIHTSINSNIASGSTSLLFEMPNLADLSGSNAASCKSAW